LFALLRAGAGVALLSQLHREPSCLTGLVGSDMSSNHLNKENMSEPVEHELRAEVPRLLVLLENSWKFTKNPKIAKDELTA
jgi:hypothetical protein